MFDLNIIEQDWLKNYRALNENEILDIFKEDCATISQYEESMKKWIEITKVNIPGLSAEEKLMKTIFKESYEDENLKKQRERMQRLKEIKLAKYPEPKKRHLSEKNQKRVVEGSMHFVFKYVKQYYNVFQSKISKETLYYLLVETLINVSKYMTHCGKPVFSLYVISSFENRIIRYIKQIEKVSYHEAREIVKNYEEVYYNFISFDNKNYITEKHNLLAKNQEIVVSPTDLKYYMRNIIVNEDIIKNLNTEEFFKVYNQVLDELNYEEKIVMKLSYNNNGDLGLTYKEIADYLGIEKKQVGNIKRRALKHLRQNDIIKLYKL